MTQRYSRSGSVRPTRQGSERTIWYLMRLTGLALFVLSLSHFLILHVLYDPKDQTAAFIANVRWSSLFWRANDWLFLTVVIVHAVLGNPYSTRPLTAWPTVGSSPPTARSRFELRTGLQQR